LINVCVFFNSAHSLFSRILIIAVAFRLLYGLVYGFLF